MRISFYEKEREAHRAFDLLLLRKILAVVAGKLVLHETKTRRTSDDESPRDPLINGWTRDSHRGGAIRTGIPVASASSSSSRTSSVRSVGRAMPSIVDERKPRLDPLAAGGGWAA
jgi:hypothetical protein